MNSATLLLRGTSSNGSCAFLRTWSPYPASNITMPGREAVTSPEVSNIARTQPARGKRDIFSPAFSSTSAPSSASCLSRPVVSLALTYLYPTHSKILFIPFIPCLTRHARFGSRHDLFDSSPLGQHKQDAHSLTILVKKQTV